MSGCYTCYKIKMNCRGLSIIVWEEIKHNNNKIIIITSATLKLV